MKKEKTFFCKQFKNIMFEKGFTQNDLAKKLGVGQEIISRWVNGGRNPSVSSLKKIAKALDVPMSYFVEKNSFDVDINDIKEIKNQINIMQEKMKRYETEFDLLNKQIELLKIKIDKKK